MSTKGRGSSDVGLKGAVGGAHRELSLLLSELENRLGGVAESVAHHGACTAYQQGPHGA